MVLGLSNEDPQKVSDYVDQMGLTVRIASGSNSSGDYGVKGIPASCLIDTEGTVVWFGHPSSLSDSKVKEALKGAKPRSDNFLAIVPDKELDGRLASIGKSMEQGKIGKALAALQPILADESADETEKGDAKALATRIEEHVAVLNTQAGRFLESRDVAKAMTVYEAISDEFAGHEFGTTAKSKVDEIKKDKALMKELDASEALAKLQKSVAKLATSKRTDKLKDFAEKWSGTRAADRARAMSAKKD